MRISQLIHFKSFYTVFFASVNTREKLTEVMGCITFVGTKTICENISGLKGRTVNLSSFTPNAPSLC